MKTNNGKRSTSARLAPLLGVLFAAALTPFLAHAQSRLGSANFRGGSFENGFGLKGIEAYGGVGFADFEVRSPAKNFRMDQGIYAFIGGQREVNDSGLAVTISFGYMTTKGEADYNYTTLGGVVYQGTDIGFNSTNYQLGLGLKQRFFPHSWFRPYIEAGGLFGYHEISYTSPFGKIVPVVDPTGTADPNGYKKDDGLVGFGYYGEGGLEVDFSDTYGIKVAGHYQDTTTRPFDTLGSQKVKFDTLVFLLAMMIRF